MEVIEWLVRLKNSLHPYAAIAKDVRPRGEAGMKLDGPQGIDTQGPDGAFGYIRCGRPGVVIEVTWSQQPEEVVDKASNYIRGSGGRIRTVVHLNCHDMYLEERTAQFSVWRAAISDIDGEESAEAVESVRDKIFRDSKGRPVRGVELRLSLSDFICHAETPSALHELSHAPDMVIASDQLCTLVDEALEAKEKDKKENERIEQKKSQERERIRLQSKQSGNGKRVRKGRALLNGVLRRSERNKKPPERFSAQELS
ncbi:MAG: hypothetical protein M1821_009321 [Bathelium mastoideum]|nr:MAG: hypothetical protein M1821_009321 [Bathelium mastoideum]